MPGPKHRPKAGNKFADSNDLAYIKIQDGKKEAAKQARREAEQSRRRQRAADFDLQQATLNIFKNSFPSLLQGEDNGEETGKLGQLLQEVKAALFNREFERAFGKEEYLEAYAARWSPTRALAYEGVLRDVKQHLAGLWVDGTEEVEETVVEEKTGEEKDAGKEEAENVEGDKAVEETPAESSSTLETLTSRTSTLQISPSSPSLPTTKTTRATRKLNLLSIGGGAAELVAFASFLGRCQPASLPPATGSITLVDSGPWSTVITKLYDQLTIPPPLAKYASAAVKAANSALVQPSRLESSFAQHDVLELSKEKLGELVGPNPTLITLLFTLNELFAQGGIGATTKFLLDLTAVSCVGCVLLVVDSPGSYSETTVGKSSKKYPMQWLMDKVLSSVEGEKKWTKLESSDSNWYRLSDGLEYPIPLENMRYQLHVYRLDAGEEGL